MYLWYDSMYFYVFSDIVIGILPSHSPYNISTIRTPYIFVFTIHNDSLPDMLYHYPLSPLNIDPF
jgi:hypothetical protein